MSSWGRQRRAKRKELTIEVNHEPCFSSVRTRITFTLLPASSSLDNRGNIQLLVLIVDSSFTGSLSCLQGKRQRASLSRSSISRLICRAFITATWKEAARWSCCRLDQLSLVSKDERWSNRERLKKYFRKASSRRKNASNERYIVVSYRCGGFRPPPRTNDAPAGRGFIQFFVFSFRHEFIRSSFFIEFRDASCIRATLHGGPGTSDNRSTSILKSPGPSGAVTILITRENGVFAWRCLTGRHDSCIH